MDQCNNSINVPTKVHGFSNVSFRSVFLCPLRGLVLPGSTTGRLKGGAFFSIIGGQAMKTKNQVFDYFGIEQDRKKRTDRQVKEYSSKFRQIVSRTQERLARMPVNAEVSHV